jgi:DNA repair protein RecN (Recombination protein N)
MTMLKSIHIQNFALAQNLSIQLEQGLNIMTGETGTGKSIIVGAISAVLGARIFTEVVRTGAEKAVVDAIFDIKNLKEVQTRLGNKGLGNDEELFLRREISTKGQTRAFINDIPVTITTLAEIGDLLVDIHGQNEHQSLLRKETHRYFLDAYGKLDREGTKVSEQFSQVEEAVSNLKQLEDKRKNLDEKYELFQFQMNEISKAKIQPGEDESLEAERKILANTEKIVEYATEFNRLTEGTGDSNLLELLGQALHTLKELANYSEEIEKITKEFSSAKIVVEEAARSVEEFQSKLEFNPERLEEIELRLATLSQLKKKYGGSIQSILEHLESIRHELSLRENFDFEIEKLQQIYQQKLNEYHEAALILSNARKETAKKLEKEVIELLKEIGMPKILFRVNIEWIESETGIFSHHQKKYNGDENGIDDIEFFISPNPGEEFKPLTKIASGGEISRIMLALKNILAETDKIPLLIFDEIDAGVSGKIASSVGKSIEKLAGSHQIICITHLPQIASFGRTHLRVEKFEENGRTFTRVLSLNQEERIKEIANLIGGKRVSAEILQSAEQLLSEAQS